VGGVFLGLAYFDLTYHLMIILVMVAKFSGVLDKTRVTSTMAPAKNPPPHPSSRFEHEGVGRRI
jgi:hypothetical protein